MSLTNEQAEKLNNLIGLILMPLDADCFVTLIARRLPDGRGAIEAIGQPLKESGEAAMESLTTIIQTAMQAVGAKVVDGREWNLGRN